MKKIDLSARRKALVHQESPVAESRFTHAKQILAVQPTGTGPRITASDSSQGEQTDVVVAEHDEVLGNPLNARHSYKEARITELAASIAKHGQLAPALACVMTDIWPLLDAPEARGIKQALMAKANATSAHYMLIGGHYRQHALRALTRPIKLNLVRVRSLLELYALSYAENDEREDTTPLDDALSWDNLLTLGIAKTQEDIANVTGKNRSTINKTLALLKLPSPVLDVFREAEAPYSYLAANTLGQLVPHVKQERVLELARQIIEGTITTRQMEEMLTQLSGEGRPRKEKEMSRQHKLHFGGREVGVIKDWDSGRVLLDIKLPDGELRQQLISELRSRFLAEGGSGAAQDGGAPS